MRFSGPGGAWLLEVQTDAVTRILAADPGGRALDVGGGHGQLVQPLLDAGCDITMLTSTVAARGMASVHEGPRVRFHTGPLQDPPYPDRSFDVVVCFRILSHVSDWQGMLRNLCRVARTRVVFDVPVPAGVHRLGPAFFGIKRRLEGNTRPWRALELASVEAVLRSCGFEPVHVIPQFALPMVLHRRLARPTVSRAAEGLLRRAGITRRFGSPAVVGAVRRDVAGAE